MTSYSQPTIEQEEANAAFVWLKECQTNLVTASSNWVGLDRDQFERIEFCFLRYKTAYETAVNKSKLTKCPEIDQH